MGQIKDCAEPYGDEGQIEIWASLIWRQIELLLMVSKADRVVETVSLEVMAPRVGWRPCQEHSSVSPSSLMLMEGGGWEEVILLRA